MWAKGQGAVLSEQPPKRKLIEVSLPLEAINRESAREKSIRHGHPRRSTCGGRAVRWPRRARCSSLSSSTTPPRIPEQFPTEEAQQAERERLHRLIERLVVWENIRDEELLAEAHEEILKSTDGNPPPILDPFAGGGTIPLEAQRLGLEAHASDLNPVAVLINKALIEIPPKFADRPPVFPGLAETEMAGWKGADGPGGRRPRLRRVDARRGREADRQALPEGEAPRRHRGNGDRLDLGTDRDLPESGLWDRDAASPFVVARARRRGREAYVVPRIVPAASHPGGRRVEFDVGHDLANAPTRHDDGTIGRNGARCVACGATVSLAYLRTVGREAGLGDQLVAIVAEGQRRRVYLPASQSQVDAAIEVTPPDGPIGALPEAALGFRVQGYGFRQWSDLFTDRQLLALDTLSDLVSEARERALQDALRSGFPSGERLAAGGSDGVAYADAIATYLGLIVSRMANRSSSQCFWATIGETVEPVFSRNAISMVWTYAESNPLSSSTGNLLVQVEYLVESIRRTPAAGVGIATQADAATLAYSGAAVISTDPPYYDNLGYADLSDFFYVWLRRTIRDVQPELFATVLVPKAEELIANPHRHGGSDGAKRFFEDGFRRVFSQALPAGNSECPATVYYAFKQSDLGEDGEASTGWETLLEGMIEAGWQITATWPMRTEQRGGLRDLSRNALASSIVLALRARADGAPTIDRRGFISALQTELPGALQSLQQGQVAPVDLPQAAIGPGMAVFSRYSSVIESDGSQMSVRSALARINEILDQVLNEQEGDFDPTTRFGIAWYRQHGYGTGKFGDANNLANARNTTVDGMARAGILASAAGKVTLLAPTALPDEYDPLEDELISAWEVLHHMVAALERGGIDESRAIARERLRPGPRVPSTQILSRSSPSFCSR